MKLEKYPAFGFETYHDVYFCPKDERQEANSYLSGTMVSVNNLSKFMGIIPYSGLVIGPLRIAANVLFNNDATSRSWQVYRGLLEYNGWSQELVMADAIKTVARLQAVGAFKDLEEQRETLPS